VLWPLLKADRFPAAAWDPALQAQTLLAEFAGYKWRKRLDPIIEAHMWPKDWNTKSDEIQADVNDLIRLRKQRSAYLGEIVAQAEDLAGYWAQMLMVTPKSHPTTWMLISAAMAIGHMVGMCYKMQENRPRPVQLYPALMPVITTPPHPSFPNNHMLQSGLIAALIGKACNAYSRPANSLAYRIGLNRLRAGLHFRTDLNASIALSNEISRWIDAKDPDAPFDLLRPAIEAAGKEFGNPEAFNHTVSPYPPKKPRSRQQPATTGQVPPPTNGQAVQTTI
jgi:acid phosphatase (class A)